MMQIGQTMKIASATLKFTKQAQTSGEYKPTGRDEQKKSVEFRLVSTGKKNGIVWNSGKSELVTDAMLAKLQASHSWTTDF